MKTQVAATVLAVLAATPALAHRLDEYLQGAILSVDKSRLHAQLTLTPGVAVFPIVFAAIDMNADGRISEIEERTYARQVLNDLSLTMDDQPLIPRLLSFQFPATDEMKQGRGEILIELDADLSVGTGNRRIVLKNNHQNAISAYQVNCLVPSDPDIRIVAQNRNYSQSLYEVDYVQTGADSQRVPFSQWAGVGWAGGFALLLFARFALLRKGTPPMVQRAAPKQ